jgi:hypothetical protein
MDVSAVDVAGALGWASERATCAALPHRSLIHEAKSALFDSLYPRCATLPFGRRGFRLGRSSLFSALRLRREQAIDDARQV